MKIVHVVRQFFPSIGGMEEVVFNIAREHRRLGGNVRIVTLNTVFTEPSVRLPAHDQYDQIPIQRIGYRGSSRYPIAPEVLQTLQAADRVHVHGIDFFFDFLALTKMLHRKPLLASTHGGFFHTDFASRAKKLWFQTITRASCMAYQRVIATSVNDGHLFAQITRADRLTVIENGVDIAKFADASAVSSGRTLLYFGRWSVNKGLMEILQLTQALRSSDPQWRLIIAGRAYDYDVADLQEAVAARQLTGCVDIIANPDADRLKSLIRKAQFYICLSRHEGFGIAALEAMSAGLTPILSQIPPFARLVRESGCGLLLAQRTLAEQVEAINQLALQVDQNMSDYRRRAMQFTTRYGWHDVARRYIQEYESMRQA